MCFGSPSIPEPPKLPPPLPPAPPPPPMPEPEMPTPAPELVQSGTAEAGGVRAAKTKRQANQQASKGTSSLRIPLNTGKSAASPAGGLNIPK